jgi:hypothetical protein
MNKCVECDVETADKDLLYDKTEKCYLCRKCFVGALVGNTKDNKALSHLMRNNPMGVGAATKAAELMFAAQKRTSGRLPTEDRQ